MVLNISCVSIVLVDTIRYCRCTTKCKECGNSHHTLLHEDSKYASPETHEGPFMETHHADASQVKARATSPGHETAFNPVASASARNTDCKVRLMVVPVRVYGDDIHRSSKPTVYWIAVQKSRFAPNLSFTNCKCMVNQRKRPSLE